MDFNKINIQDLQLKYQLDVQTATGGVTGSVQIPVPEGRNNFGPALQLNYNSGAGNSVFGMGWTLSGISFISLDTKKGLPKYDGTDDYAFNGGTSLVPSLVRQGSEWKNRVDETPEYWVYYYRPKVEELFVRFEKWIRKDNLTVHWKTITTNHIVSVFGIRNGVIRNPQKNENIFVWLLEEQYDNLGNVIYYTYKNENSENVDPLKSFEYNRVKKGLQFGFAQKYPDRILYGNSLPFFPGQSVPSNNKWHFETVFDYGEYASHPYETNIPDGIKKWNLRSDPFSVYHPGFEIRTYRLCHRILTYHNIPDLSAKPSLTGIFEILYNENPSGSTINKVSFSGVRRDLVHGTYSEKRLPSLSFEYTSPKPAVSFTPGVRVSIVNVPQGFNSPDIRFVDLFGEGLPGILTETANNWYYKSNRGEGVFDKQEVIISKPCGLTGTYALGDFDQDGNLNLYSLLGRNAGYFEYDSHKETWSGFRAFKNIPQVSHVKYLDVNADGFAELVFENSDSITCYLFEGKEGFGKPFEFAKPVSDESVYAPMLGDNLLLDYYMADMTGDGLPDQVRIKNGRVEYFPNLGHGHFGEAVLMEDSPVIDFEDGFDAGRIRLYDLNGSGTSDIIYIGRGEIRYWYNASGNRFTGEGRIQGLPHIDLLSSAVILDFLGNGTPCLVWSNSLCYAAEFPVHYLELTGGEKPGLLTRLNNGTGAVTEIIYGYSGNHYLNALRSGTGWITKIPYHFTVADKKMITDTITQSKITTTYKYYDGHYDGNERNFVCFGRIEQFDTEVFDNAFQGPGQDYCQPNCTRTWLHPGMFGWDLLKAGQFDKSDPKQPGMPFSFFEETDALDSAEFLSGCRTLAGKILRQEVFAADFDGQTARYPFSVTQRSYAVRKIQPATTKHDGCFYSFQTEAMEISYDRVPEDPRITHHFSLHTDEFGNITKELNIAYARRNAIPGAHHQQNKDYVTLSLHSFCNTDSLVHYQSGVLCESKTFEVNQIHRNQDAPAKWKEVKAGADAWANHAIAFDKTLPDGAATVARLIEWNRTFFWNDLLDAVLPHGQTGKVALAHHEETACFNDALIQEVFNGKVTGSMLSDNEEGNYIKKEGYWWQRTAVNYFHNADGFYSLHRVEKHPGTFTSYVYDDYHLSIIEITDPLGNKTRGKMDYNLIEPCSLTDANDNISEVLYDPLGVPVVNTFQGTVLDNGINRDYGFDLADTYIKRNDESFDNIIAQPERYLQHASSFLFYDFESNPLRSVRIVRENLLYDGKGNTDNNISVQIELDYQDGFGRIIQNKRKAEQGPAIVRNTDGTVKKDTAGELVFADTNERWLVSGHVVYNNKQQPVRQFEPFFSGIHTFESDAELDNYGVTIQQFYDSTGRMYRTDYPDSTFSETLFSPWEIKTFDRNDTVDRSLYKVFREVRPAGSPERMALDKSLAHKDTPVIVQFDPAGREIVRVQINNDGTERKVETLFDINGNAALITDSRGLRAFEYKRDMCGRLLYEKSMDAGEKWNFYNNGDQAIHFWDSRNVHQRTHYDALDRVMTVRVNGALGLDQITERFIYGEDASVVQARERNLRGALVIHYDQAGLQEVKLAAPGSLPLHTERRLLDQYTSEPDWENPSTMGLSPEVYRSVNVYDGLGRIVRQQLPDHTTREFVFNQGGGLGKILVSTADGTLNRAELLKQARYDAKGMRQSVLLGNDVEIVYTYDSENFRMKRLISRDISGTGRIYQDIHYTYDPEGNVVYLVDDAQQPAAVNPHVLEGLNVSSHSEFEYDALYQLISASGRAHQALLQHDYADRSRETGVPADWGKGTRHITLNNGASVERYTRTYAYDEAGNIKTIRHTGVSRNWTTQIWTSGGSNRSLPLHDMNGNTVTNPEGRFDANGNCTFMPHIRSLEWNYRNNISRAVLIDRTAQGRPNDEEYYVYGGDGMRIRKINQRLTDVSGNMVELTEKIYLEGCEIKRVIRGGTELLKRFTSNVDDGIQTIAKIHSWDTDTLTRETGDTTKKKIHYQLTNHLGSASVELDDQGDVITSEEYFPYGGTAYIAGRNRRDIDLKEYRYSGKERDDCTGLYYFGYRYYAHWIGGWLSPDPLGPEDSENLYLYVQNNPVNLVDPNGLQSTGEYRTIGTVETGLTEAEAMSQFNASQGFRMGIRVLDLERRGNDWVILRFRNLTQRELERFQEIQERWAENPEIAELFTQLEVSLGDINVPDLSVSGEQTTTPGNGSDGDGQDGSGNTTGQGLNNGDGGVGSQSLNGGDGNSGDGGNGSRGTDSHDSGSSPHGTGINGVGSSNRTSTTGTSAGEGLENNPGTGTNSGSRSRSQGQGTGGNQGTENGHRDGQVGGSSMGVPGGQIGGSVDGILGGNSGGESDGSLVGDFGSPQEGTSDGIAEESGNPSGTGGQVQDQPRRTDESTETGHGAQEQQGQQGQQGQNQSGSTERNWLDTATRWAGYLNLEFGGSEGTGGAGGIPGGLDLFGWRPPMWVRRTLQVLYIATTIVTTIIPIGKVALAAKVAVQGALKLGIRAVARQLITRVASRIPSRAAIRGVLTRTKGIIGSGLSRIGGLFTTGGIRAMAAGKTISPSSPSLIVRGFRWLMFRGKSIPHTVSPISTPGTLGTTSASGVIRIRPGLSAAQHTETLFHEGAHRFLTPLGTNTITRARQSFGMWGYKNSHLLRYLEEGFAQSIGSGSFRSGFAWINAHVRTGGYGLNATRIAVEGSLYGGGILGTGYLFNQYLNEE